MNTDRDTSEWAPWQQAYRHGTLVIRPPEPVRTVIDRWRERFDPVSRRYSDAHVTLTQPFKASVTDDVLNSIAIALAEEGAFEIAYGPLRSFLPSPVLWLEVQPAQRVLAIRQRLHATGLFDLSLPHTDGFVPHMTITEGMSGPGVDQELLDSLAPQIESGTFMCDQVALIQPVTDFRFSVVHEIALRAA